MNKGHSFTAWMILLLIGCFSIAKAQTIALPKECKLKFGDDISWANASLIDTGWEKIQLGFGFHLEEKKDTYIWFRIKVMIPSRIKSLAEFGKGVKLNLGKIDDIDQTYFNGKLIGATGSFPPNYIGKYQANRVYVIPVNEIKWDQENVIAVRAYSPDSWFGMYEGPYQLAAAQWSDFISVNHQIVDKGSGSFNTIVKFHNNKANSFTGTIEYKVFDKNNGLLFSETRPVKIQPVEGLTQTINFTTVVPITNKIVRVSYTVIENKSNAAIKKEQLYLVDNQFSLGVKPPPKPVVDVKIRDVFSSVNLDQQQMKGYLGNRMNRNLVARLLKIDEIGVLDGYLERPGHHPWAGEHVGKYLETAANVWRNTGNQQLKKQMDQIMFQLINSQLPDGYLGTYIQDDYWTSWDVWSHKYNLYGLLAYYKNTGYEPALDACKKIGNLLCATFGNKPGQLDIILAGTHIGMAATSVLDPMVELFKYTGDKKYLNFCYYILDAWEQPNGPKIISTLMNKGKVTNVGNGKAYEMLSNFVGIANLYSVSGDDKLLKSVLIAWKDIVSNRLYITGTTSSHEYFQENQILPAGSNANMGEGCVTTTWIQLNQSLFNITGKIEYLDQIEKSIYNHLLAAENPVTGCVSYYTSLMDQKPYNCEITCCTSSVPRGIALIPYFGFGKLNGIPTLLLYETAKYQTSVITKENKTIPLTVQVESKYPDYGQTSIVLNGFQKGTFSFTLRLPKWASAYTATIGNQTYKGNANEYLVLERNWKSGDRINITFEIATIVLDGGISYPGQISYQRGAQILAFDSKINSKDVIDQLKEGKLQFADRSISNSFLKGLPKQWIGKQLYEVRANTINGVTNNKSILLVPFADASQTGGIIKVWLPSSKSNKN